MYMSQQQFYQQFGLDCMDCTGPSKDEWKLASHIHIVDWLPNGTWKWWIGTVPGFAVHFVFSFCACLSTHSLSNFTRMSSTFPAFSVVMILAIVPSAPHKVPDHQAYPKFDTSLTPAPSAAYNVDSRPPVSPFV